MKKLIALGLLLSVSAFARTSMTGDKIHFQSVSTWVNSYYSKSLCFDGENFHAKVKLCAEWNQDQDDRRCVAYKIVDAVQPQESTRQRCKTLRSDRDGGNCEEWETVRYFQSENRTIKFYREDSEGSRDLIKTVNLTVPACN